MDIRFLATDEDWSRAENQFNVAVNEVEGILVHFNLSDQELKCVQETIAKIRKELQKPREERNSGHFYVLNVTLLRQMKEACVYLENK